MKRISILAIAGVCMLAIVSCDQKSSGSGNASLSSPLDSASYAVGVNYGDGLRQSLATFPGGEANVDAMVEGFVKGIRGDSASLKMSPVEAQTFIQQYLTNIQMKEFEAEKTKGEAFLAENRSKEGVITTESGLQYKVIKEGNGPKPSSPQDVVKVHYTGKLLDGTVFDSSAGREPIEFQLDRVIRGWTEGVQIMPTGSKYIFWIPSELAYGQQGAGQNIKPNSTLEFEIELLEIVKK